MATGFSYRFTFIAALCICSVYGLQSQKAIEPERMRQFNITVNADDHITKTQMLQYSKAISTDNDRVYMWYGSQKILETKGGYAGKLIHGPYKSFYFNGQLKEQGEICYGLKNGEWKCWSSDGKLKEVIHWHKGIKKGSYTLYNDLGQIIAKGHFKNNKLHGRFYTYGSTGNILEKKRYRHGNEVVAKKPKEKAPDKCIKEKKEKGKKLNTAPEPPKETEKHELLKEVSWLQRLFKKKTKPAPAKEPAPERKIINS